MKLGGKNWDTLESYAPAMVVRRIALWLLRKVAWKLGYVLFRWEQNPLSTYGDDPREVPYLQDLPHSTQYLPANMGVGLRFYSFFENTYHPFVIALKVFRDNGNKINHAFDVLKKFNQLCSFQSANDFFGLTNSESCFSDQGHPYEYTYPWSPQRPKDVKALLLQDVRGENRRHGFHSEEAFDLPHASDRKIWIETERLVGLMDSIDRNGFKLRSHDSLGCFVLVKGGKWRWYVHGGQHRAAVLAVLGYVKFPVCVRRIIRRQDVDFWPQVQSGLFTRAQALIVFDKLFAAKPPNFAKHWINYIDQTFYHTDTNV